MLTYSQAREIAASRLSEDQFKGDYSTMILDTEAVETEYAWIIPYTSEFFLKTGDMSFALAGNAPFFISKYNGEVVTYTSTLDLEAMILLYEEENKIWELALNEDLRDLKKFADLKRILGWTISEVSDYKKQNQQVLASGARLRLEGVQEQLRRYQIDTILKINSQVTSISVDARTDGTNR